MEIKDLKPASYNPRIMKEKAKKGLRRSLKEFGDLSGITWNRTTGNLVTGHHRLEQLQAEYGEQLTLVPSPDGKSAVLLAPGGDEFAVRVVDWDKTKEMAANVTANNLGIQGSFTDQLQPLLWKIKEDLKEKFSQVGMDQLVRHAKSKVIEGEEEFSEVLNECNQYLVLVFRNSVDWLNAVTHFELETKTSQRANGKSWSSGIGRVLDGAKYLKKLTERGG